MFRRGRGIRMSFGDVRLYESLFDAPGVRLVLAGRHIAVPPETCPPLGR
jgi:hypothetical protein